jgi:hypothetical protein
VDALQAILKAWNQSTPAANLPGWSLTGSNDSFSFPCFVDVPWKGVLCLQYVDPNNPNITLNYSIAANVVVGL